MKTRKLENFKSKRGQQLPQSLYVQQTPVRVSSSVLGPVDPSFRALSGRLQCTVRRHTFNKDSLLWRAEMVRWCVGEQHDRMGGQHPRESVLRCPDTSCEAARGEANPPEQPLDEPRAPPNSHRMNRVGFYRQSNLIRARKPKRMFNSSKSLRVMREPGAASIETERLKLHAPNQTA